MRIERLWVDVTAQVGAFWADMFTTLELQHGLDINNIHHIWLLHFYFCQLSISNLHFLQNLGINTAFRSEMAQTVHQLIFLALI